MTKAKISDLMIFTDEIKLGGKTRRLAFDNRALGYAEQYCRHQGFPLDCERIIKECSELELRAVLACLYGTIKSADRQYTISRFVREINHEKAAEYFEKIAIGLARYLPDRSAKGKFNAEAVTDSNDVIGDYFELARKVLKMSDEDILNSSMRLIENKLSLSLGIDEDSKAGYIDSIHGF